MQRSKLLSPISYVSNTFHQIFLPLFLKPYFCDKDVPYNTGSFIEENNFFTSERNQEYVSNPVKIKKNEAKSTLIGQQFEGKNFFIRTDLEWLREIYEKQRPKPTINEKTYEFMAPNLQIQIFNLHLGHNQPQRDLLPVLMGNNNKQLQSNQKNPKIRMFYYPPPNYTPQYLYYVYIPTNQSIPQEISPIQEHSSPKAIFTVPEYTLPEEEKLILTRQDLEKQGYEQTKRPWTPEEDKLLMKLCRDQNARFQEIAAKVEGRNAKMCYSRYRRLTYETRATWTREEDQRLLSLVEQYGDEAWKAIVPQFQGRTHKQLKDHYLNYLKPDLLKSEWTIQEDLQLIRLINLHGKNWRLVEEGLEGRSRNQIKNRYFGRILRLNKKKAEQAV